MKIKLKKISETAAPKYKAANWDNFVAGIDNGNVSLPIEYELTGVVKDLEIGKSLLIDRDSRNGVECFGVFCSTEVKNIVEKDGFQIIETENSVYLLENLG